ncbi:hypothetical protein AC781_01655 [Akkermansia glycaniphila]|nr:hypothetical protein AC781_01655 [Akkermansia glycaniphila]
MRHARFNWGNQTPGGQLRAMKYPATTNSRHIRPDPVNHIPCLIDITVGACVSIVASIVITRAISTHATRGERLTVGNASGATANG